jgi:2-amino-4-hydroxy-6-hydroxymethyldihydropteridine diphosphokinase
LSVSRNIRKIIYNAYIVLGSNIAPDENMRKAISLLKSCTPVQKISTTWETPPVGTDGPNFYNTAVHLTTHLVCEGLKSQILRPIEIQLGRIRTADKYAPRTIDIDIIIFDGEVLDPRLWSYAYLAVPLAELIPELPHPETGRTLASIAMGFLSQGDLIPHPEIAG